MFNANGKALEGGSEEVIQCPHKHPEQVGKGVVASPGRGPFLLCKERAGREEGRDGVIWQLESGELSKFLS